MTLPTLLEESLESSQQVEEKDRVIGDKISCSSATGIERGVSQMKELNNLLPEAHGHFDLPEFCRNALGIYAVLAAWVLAA